MDDAGAHARALLEANRYLVLSTADAAGNPWATPVWFAPDGLDRLFWLSWPGARHSLLLDRRPQVALTVFDSTVAPHQGAAFYATASAQQCPDALLDEALEIVNHRGEPQGLDAFTREQLCGPARLRLYVATHTEMWVLDQDADVDQRLPVRR